MTDRSPIAALARLSMRLLLRYRVLGGENVPTGGPLVVVANHVGFLDPILLKAVLNRNLAYAIDPQMARLWWVRPVAALASTHGVDPARPYAIRELLRTLEAGGIAAVFPESRLTVTTGLMDVYDGAAFLALRSGAPVLPVHIAGMEASALTRLRRSQARRSPKPEVDVTIGQPFTLAGAGDRLEGTALIRSALAALARDQAERLLANLGAVGMAARRVKPGQVVLQTASGNHVRLSDLMGAVPGVEAWADRLRTVARDPWERGLAAAASERLAFHGEHRVASLLPPDSRDGRVVAAAVIAGGASLMDLWQAGPRTALERITIGNATHVACTPDQARNLLALARPGAFHAVRAFVSPALAGWDGIAASLARPVIALPQAECQPVAAK